MIWQDTVLAAGSWLFSLALVPSLIGDRKPELWTSVLTSCVLAVFAGVELTLHLPLAFWSTTLNAILWGALGVQVYRERVRNALEAEEFLGRVRRIDEKMSGGRRAG